MTDKEYILIGGNTAGRVVRIGPTVRKPVTIATPAVISLLNFLRDSGCFACPQHFGIDEQGRQMLEFVPGVVANAGPPLSLLDLEKVGELIRELHDVSSHFPILAEVTWDAQICEDTAELICHNDLAPWNLVRNEGQWVFIDWDNAGPGSRLWDLAYAALTFPPVESQGDIAEVAFRIGALIRGYGLSPRLCRMLPPAMSKRAQAMADYLSKGAAEGIEPIVYLDATGHTTYWAEAARFVGEQSEVLARLCCECLPEDKP